MRVIAGIYRGRILKSPPDQKTRPTSDRLRETVFNILNPTISAATRFLDLCAGTGAVGIEALSRGAEFVTFVDRSRRACALIEENLDLLDIPETQTKVISTTAKNFVGRHEEKQDWNIVYYDPPYSDDYAPVLFEFGDSEMRLLAPEGIFIAEHHAKNSLPDAAHNLRRWRILKQGETCLSFYHKN